MMEKKEIQTLTWEEFVLRMKQALPTGQVIHDEIGISWEVIAREVYYCSRNDVNKYAKYLPSVYYTVKQGEAVKAVMDIWDKAVHAYQKAQSCQK